ncbi:MAG: preprotein translocase subunit SecY [Actinobacteria bacterium]|nr:preprotein translocase subunit SecY [Actinomycetota bacterium]
MLKVPDLRNKILFTIAMLMIYRLGSYLPVPGIDQDAVNAIKEQARQGGVLSFLQLFSGKALTQFALFALGIMPYITSSIIMQILTVVIPKLQQLIAILQSTGLVFLFKNGGGGLSTNDSINLVPNFGLFRVMLIVGTLTAGTALLMWMGEAITQRGIGNGMSLIIFSSVVSALPATGTQVQASAGWGGVVLVIAMAILMLVFVVFIEQGQRRIPVEFAKRVVGRRQYGGQRSYIPLKVNQAGVIPIIFASAVINLPVLLSQVLPADGWGKSVSNFIDDVFRRSTHPLYMVFYGLLIVGFAYFYTAIAFDPVQQADNLRKQSGHIPGYRPGPQTEKYLAKVLSRITLPGALFIAVLAIAPAILVSQIVNDDNGSIAYNFGGTSLLIAVGVALETMKQIDGQLMMRNYEGFLGGK